jgi:hypothetical protein
MAHEAGEIISELRACRDVYRTGLVDVNKTLSTKTPRETLCYYAVEYAVAFCFPCASQRRLDPLKGDFERMARKRYQRGQLFLKGKRQRVWVARWREDIIRPDGSTHRLRRSESSGLDHLSQGKHTSLVQ